MPTKAKLLGNQGENAAAVFLQSLGFSILKRNFRTRLGEVDIIAQKDDVLTFVEVKTRATEYFAISRVLTQRKQSRIAKAAKQYIVEKQIYNKVCRFDLITVLGYTKESFKISHFPNAFCAP